MCEALRVIRQRTNHSEYRKPDYSYSASSCRNRASALVATQTACIITTFSAGLNTRIARYYLEATYPKTSVRSKVRHKPHQTHMSFPHNRDNSYDSRYFGFVDRDAIVGRATAVIASWNAEHFYLPRKDRFFLSLP